MAKGEALRFDTIGTWSEVKLAILREYAKAYSTILAKHPRLYHIYIDAFAGAGVHRSRQSGQLVPGSPLNALAVMPEFREYHLIDLRAERVENLRAMIGERPDVMLYAGDCNEVLLGKVFPRARYEDYRRALCLLDPYGLHVSWTLVAAAGQMKSIDLFLNFPIEGVNRDALWTDPSGLDQDRIDRMTWVWGDATWRDIAYVPRRDLFGREDVVKRPGNEPIVRAFQDRLKRVAGFTFVPDPMPMRNSRGAVVYYLYFASHNPAGAKIARDIFRKYRSRGAA